MHELSNRAEVVGEMGDREGPATSPGKRSGGSVFNNRTSSARDSSRSHSTSVTNLRLDAGELVALPVVALAEQLRYLL